MALPKNRRGVAQFYQSQRDDQRGGGVAPVEPHLALKTESEQWLAIPPGARMAIIVDPRRVDGFFELVFEKVKLKQGVPIEVHFKVPSDKPNSTRKAIMTIAWAGLYTSWLEQETKRQLVEQEAEAKRKAMMGAKEAIEAEDGDEDDPPSGGPV